MEEEKMLEEENKSVEATATEEPFATAKEDTLENGDAQEPAVVSFVSAEDAIGERVCSPERKLHRRYLYIIATLVVILIAGVVIVMVSFKNAVSEEKAEYDEARASFEEAYAKILSEEEAWTEELKKTNDALNDANSKLEEIYRERQEEIDAEKARWDGMSKEEQEAELKCYAYNETVAYLRANNEEYRSIYVQLAAFLDQNLLDLDPDRALEYTALYERMKAIEQEYYDSEDGKNPAKGE